MARKDAFDSPMCLRLCACAEALISLADKTLALTDGLADTEAQADARLGWFKADILKRDLNSVRAALASARHALGVE